MEAHIGRALKSSEGVHHIDGDKSNNKIENLYLSESCKHHRNLHIQLERCGFDLFKKGLIHFIDGRYIVSDLAK